MLKRFEKLLEIAKNDEEFKKELASSLDKIESDRNLKLFEVKIFDKDKIKEVASKVLCESVFECLCYDKVRLINNTLNFAFKVGGGDMIFKINLKDYTLIDFKIIRTNGLPISEEDIEKRCNEIKQRINSFSTLENECLCNIVIRESQENYLKEEKTVFTKSTIDKMKYKLDLLSEYIDDMPNVSVSDVECECSAALRILDDIEKILKKH